LLGGPPQAAAAPDHAAQILLPGLRWSIDISAAPSVAPVVADGYVYLPLKPGILAAHRTKDGGEAWRVHLAADQGLAAAAMQVFVPAHDAIHALDAATGREMWMAATGTVSAPLLVHSGWLIVAASPRLIAMRASDGSEVWRQDLGEIHERPAIDGDSLFVSFADGRVAALDLATGSIRWQRKLPGAATEPLVSGDRVYVGSADKNFYALDATSGELQWRWPVRATLRGRAAADGAHVYVTALDNLLRALDRGSGAQRWRRDLPFRPLGGPVVIGGAVMVPGATADLRLFDARTGRPVSKMTLDAPLAITAGYGTESGESVLSVAAITGGLNNQWKLWLYGPLPPPPLGPPIEPLSVLPGHLVPLDPSRASLRVVWPRGATPPPGFDPEWPPRTPAG
jgi:outer membrane protein assembly factor BamB